MSERHTINLDDLLDHLREDRWENYASASGGGRARQRKRLDILSNGVGFRVMVGDNEIYRGQNASDAVRAYNEI